MYNNNKKERKDNVIMKKMFCCLRAAPCHRGLKFCHIVKITAKSQKYPEVKFTVSF